jgi:cytidylate kinase
LADQRDIVCEGRDQGTAVFPQAEVKFFLRASADVRADRRVEQLRSQHLPADHATIRKMIVARDLQDETRTIDPLRPAPDAHLIDTTDLTQDDVLIHMLEIVRQWPSRA